MRGERLDRAEVTERGILGDRAYALIDVETGKVASAKSVKLFPSLLDCQATLSSRSNRVDRRRPCGSRCPTAHR
jgi:hypothetical protein